MLKLFSFGVALKQRTVNSQQLLLIVGPAYAYLAFTSCTQLQTQDQILSHQDTAYIGIQTHGGNVATAYIKHQEEGWEVGNS